MRAASSATCRAAPPACPGPGALPFTVAPARPAPVATARPGKTAVPATPLDAGVVAHLNLVGAPTEAGVQTTLREADARREDGLLIEESAERDLSDSKAATFDMKRTQGAHMGRTTTPADPDGAFDG